MCVKDNVITYAHDIEDDKVKDYLKTLEKQGYDLKNIKTMAKKLIFQTPSPSMKITC